MPAQIPPPNKSSGITEKEVLRSSNWNPFSWVRENIKRATIRCSAISIEKAGLAAILLVFASVFALISLINHYFLRTYALDLGMFNHAIYSFAHLKPDLFTLTINGAEFSYFADHFSPITVLYAPFYYLFGSYTLLVIQIAAILIGGLGIYKFGKLKSLPRFLPLIILVQFLGIWGIYAALAYDFHNNVVAAMAVPWLAYFYVRAQRKWVVVCFALVLIAKENMALWLVFILAGLMIQHRSSLSFRRCLRFELPLVVVALVYFLLVADVIMPALSPTHSFGQLSRRYGAWGSSPIEILKHLVFHPGQLFAALFEDQYGLKSQLNFMVLAAGGLVLLAVPGYLIMLVPIYLQKMLSSDPAFWGISAQYSIEFAPVLGLAVTEAIAMVKKTKLQYLLMWGLLLLTYASLFHVIADDKISQQNPINAKFYAAEHYQSSLSLSEIKRVIGQIPEDAKVSASTRLAPRLSFRDKIYLFPVIKDADYIALLIDDVRNDPNKGSFDTEVARLKNSPQYGVYYSSKDLLVFKKKQ